MWISGRAIRAFFGRRHTSRVVSRFRSSAYCRESIALIKHGLMILLLLVAATQLVERFHWFTGTDEFFARQVAVKSAPPQLDFVEPTQVTILEVSAQARLTDFEETGELTAAIADRTRGVRPTRRAQVAKLLSRLAIYLGPPDAGASIPNSELPSVIGIDVDLAPLENDRSDQHEKEMIDALDRLRDLADVVVVSFDRHLPEARTRRNQFMEKAGCRSNLPKVSSVKRDGVAGRRPLHDLYFASPVLFTARSEAPLHFPGEAGPHTLARNDLPAIFPSIGGLMSLLLHKRDPRPEAEESLTAFCDQAIAALSGRPGYPSTLQDSLAKESDSISTLKQIREHYQWWRYNWRIMDGPLIDRVSISSIEDLSIRPNSPNQVNEDQRTEDLTRQTRLRASSAIIVSIAGSGTNDQYFVPYAYVHRTSGAELHGLEILSRRNKMQEGGLDLFVDIALGMLFVILSALVIPAIKRITRILPQIGIIVSIFFPLCAGMFLAWLSIHVARWTLAYDNWINPIYVIAGLALHAYLEAWNSKQSGHGDLSWCQALSFRFDRLGQVFHDHRIGSLSERSGVLRILDAQFVVLASWAIWLGALVPTVLEEDAGLSLRGASLVLGAITIYCAVCALRQRNAMERIEHGRPIETGA